MTHKFQRALYCLFFSVFCFLYVTTAFASFIMDDIDMPEIKDMRLRKENDVYYMDVIIMVKNSGKKDIELKNCNFNLAFAVKDTDDINIGTTSKDTIILDTAGKTEMPLSVMIGSDIKRLHLNIISSDEMNSLLTDPDPELNINIRGNFDAGVKARLGWTYERGLNIDWLIKSKISRQILISAYKSIEQAADPESRTSPDDDFFENPDLNSGYEKKEEKNPDPEMAEDKYHLKFKKIIYFGWGQKLLSKHNKEELNIWVKEIVSIAENMPLHIDGHTDTDGNPKNKTISEHRAGLVKDYLTNDLKLKIKDICVAGFGEERPAVAGNDKEAGNKNRRVELYFSNI